jgi:hypothetical protein
MRLYEASCEVASPNADDGAFRFMLRAASRATEAMVAKHIANENDDVARDRAMLTRAYVATAGIKYPKDEDVQYRSELHRSIGAAFRTQKLRMMVADLGPAPKPAAKVVEKKAVEKPAVVSAAEAEAPDEEAPHVIKGFYLPPERGEEGGA